MNNALKRPLPKEYEEAYIVEDIKSTFQTLDIGMGLLNHSPNGEGNKNLARLLQIFRIYQMEKGIIYFMSMNPKEFFIPFLNHFGFKSPKEQYELFLETLDILAKKGISPERLEILFTSLIFQGVGGSKKYKEHRKTLTDDVFREPNKKIVKILEGSFFTGHEIYSLLCKEEYHPLGIEYYRNMENLELKQASQIKFLQQSSLLESELGVYREEKLILL